MAVDSYQCETPIHATTQEDINDLLEDVYEAEYDKHPETNKKPINRGDTNKPIYKSISNIRTGA